MNSKIQNAATSAIKSDISQRMGRDKLAGKHLNNQVLKIIYEFSLDLSYALLFASIGVIIIFGEAERDDLIDYCKNKSNLVYLISVVILGTIIIALKKIEKAKQIGYKCRKICNFIEDLLRSAVYIVLLCFLTPLAIGNLSLSSKLFQAYGIYLASGVMFLIMRVTKWTYYLCGSGKDEYDPWMESQIQDKLTDKQKKEIEDMMGKLIENKTPEGPQNSPLEGLTEMIF